MPTVGVTMLFLLFSVFDAFMYFLLVFVVFIFSMGYNLPILKLFDLLCEILNVGGRPSTALIRFSAVCALQQPFNGSYCFYHK
jgi:hypothetical protein